MAGADISCRDSSGLDNTWTPRDLACFHSHIDVVQRLMLPASFAKIELHAEDDWGYSTS